MSQVLLNPEKGENSLVTFLHCVVWTVEKEWGLEISDGKGYHPALENISVHA